MNRNLKLTTGCFALCLVFASGYKNGVSGETKLPKAETFPDVKIAVSPTPPISPRIGLDLQKEDIVYSVVLEDFVYSNDEKHKEIREPGIIGFRKTSVRPTGFEDFAGKNPFNLSKQVLEDFENANQKKLVLNDRYDVKDAMAAVPGEGDPLEVIKTAKTLKVKGIARDKIGVLIGLSRVGFSKDNSKTLLYAEYTTANKTKKMYIYVPFEITERSVMAHRDQIKIEFVN